MPFLDNDGVTRLTTDYLDVFARKEDAVLDPSGGLIRTDDGIGVDSLTRESDGTISGSIVELTAEGHAEQFSTTGKNLLPNNATSQTVNGVTFTVNSDGSVTANGTATSTAALYLVNSNNRPADVFPIDDATYTVSVGVESRYLTSVKWAIKTSGQGWIDNPMTKSLSGNVEAFWISVVSGATVSNCTFHPQLELGSTATAYEPYTGGLPSPRPDWEQPIEVVRGRNLLDYDEWKNSAILHGTAVWENNGVTLTATTHDCYTAYQIDSTSPVATRVSVSEGDVITLSWEADSDEGGQCYIFGNGDTSSMAKVDNASAKSVSYTVPSGVTFVTFRLGVTSSGTTIRYSNVQISLGSTPQPYVPYGHVGMEVYGKNLLPKISASSTAYGVTFTKNDDGSVSVVGTSTAHYGACFANVHYFGVRLNGMQVIFSANTVGSDIACIYALYKTSSSSWTGLFDPTPTSATVTIPNDTVDVLVRVVVRYSDRTVNATVYPMIRLASDTDDTYEPYYHITTPIPLPSRGWVGSLPDGTADVLTLDGAGKVEWELPCWMNTYDGSEDWQREELSGGRGINYYVAGQTAFAGSQYGNMMLCSHSLVTPEMKCTQGTILLDQISAMSFTYGDALGSISASEFKTWLASHNVIVLAHAATPVTEDCGYIDLPEIPSDATISIPELDALNVKYFVDDSISQYADQWYERTKAVDIADVEDAVGDLTSVVANLVTHDQFYFGYDEVNGKKMISIFKRGDI